MLPLQEKVSGDWIWEGCARCLEKFIFKLETQYPCKEPMMFD